MIQPSEVDGAFERMSAVMGQRHRRIDTAAQLGGLFLEIGGDGGQAALDSCGQSIPVPGERARDRDGGKCEDGRQNRSHLLRHSVMLPMLSYGGNAWKPPVTIT